MESGGRWCATLEHSSGRVPDRQTPAGIPESSGKNIRIVGLSYKYCTARREKPFARTHWPSTRIKLDCLHSALPRTETVLCRCVSLTNSFRCGTLSPSQKWLRRCLSNPEFGREGCQPFALRCGVFFYPFGKLTPMEKGTS